MNNIGKILFLITGFFIICSCSKRDINIDNPYFDSSNNSIIRISKVIANDSITQLFFDVNYIANEWIRIDSESYITDGKNKYMVTSSEGVMFNELFWMPESGHTSFTLSFPPLARGVKKFDFFESDCEDCFRISGVDLTEKRKKYILSKIPGKARKLKIIDGEIPMPDMSTGKTRLIFEIAGYNQNFDIEAISILRANEESIFPEISLDLEKGGRFSVKVPQHGPASYTLNINNFNCHFFAVPGKENHFWIDMNALVNNSLLTGDSEYEYEMPIYSNNGFNDINYYLNKKTDLPLYYLDDYVKNQASDIKKMHAGMLVTKLDSIYYSNMSIVEKAGLCRIERYFLEKKLQFEHFEYLANLPSLYKYASYYDNNDKWLETSDINEKLYSEYDFNNYMSHISYFDPEDENLIYTNNLISLSLIAGSNSDIKSLFGNNGSVLRKCSDFYTMLFDIPDLENLKSNELHKFINIDSSYYNYVLILREDLKMKREKLNDMSDVKICDIPEVDNEVLFDKIISRYKGCIVLVNFWTTWCVPCRTTLKRVEPSKGLLSDNKEVVFIYITNYTSPIIQWSEMVAGIKGEHYRLNNDQWNYLCKDLEIERIPACILVEKEGDFNIRNDLTSGDDIISEVNFKLEKDIYLNTTINL